MEAIQGGKQVVRKTHREVFGFVNAANRWIAKGKDPQGKESKAPSSKFDYAVAKVAKRLTKVTADYQDAVEDLNVEHCEVNDKGHILHEGSSNESYVFSKDGRKKRDAALRKLLETTVEVVPFYAKPEHVPEDLSQDTRVMFEGFVLPEPADDDTE